jgi:hypothetical protein
MARIRRDNHAFGWPGLEPRWTHGDKDGIGTAYSAAGRIWFTVWNGIPGAGHYLPKEKPEYLTAELLRLLSMSEVVDGTEMPVTWLATLEAITGTSGVSFVNATTTHY